MATEVFRRRIYLPTEFTSGFDTAGTNVRPTGNCELIVVSGLADEDTVKVGVPSFLTAIVCNFGVTNAPNVNSTGISCLKIAAKELQIYDPATGATDLVAILVIG